MLKRYTFWLGLAIVFQFLTGAVHSISFFAEPVAQNDTERQLLDLMRNYKQDAGAGFHPSTADLLTALSSCFTLLYVLGGLTNLYLYRRRITADILKGLIGIQLIVFGVSFILMLIFTFLPPIALTGLVLLFLAITYLLIPFESPASR